MRNKTVENNSGLSQKFSVFIAEGSTVTIASQKVCCHVQQWLHTEPTRPHSFKLLPPKLLTRISQLWFEMMIMGQNLCLGVNFTTLLLLAANVVCRKYPAGRSFQLMRRSYVWAKCLEGRNKERLYLGCRKFPLTVCSWATCGNSQISVTHRERRN